MPLVGGWRATLLLVLGSTVISLGAVALGGEAVVRARERNRTTVPGTMPTLYYRHGRLGYALVRNFDYFGWVHVDSAGFRGRGVPVTKRPGVLRLMVVGSSTTFDTQVSRDEAAWPARLEVSLRQLAPDRPVEVINAGVPGYRVVDNLVRLQTELFRYDPDVILLYEAHNDLFGALRASSQGSAPATDTPGEIRRVTPWGYWLSRHSLLYGKVMHRLSVIRFARRKPPAAKPDGAVSPARGDTLTDADTKDFERDVTSFLAVARSLGIRVVTAEIVNVSGVGARDEPDSTARQMWSHTVPFASTRAVLDGYVRFNAILRAVSSRLGVPFISTAGFGAQGIGLYADGDPIHFNDRGADRMGGEMARALVAARVLDLPRGAAPQPLPARPR